MLVIEEVHHLAMAQVGFNLGRFARCAPRNSWWL